MHYRGYRAIPLSPTEEADLAKQATPEAMSAWVDRFYGRDDFTQRLSLVTVPALPELVEEPLSYGAVRFDPSRLVPATGVVKRDGVVLSGPVTYRAVAQLIAPVDLSETRTWPAGTVLHAVLLPAGSVGYTSFWCAKRFCVRDNNGGYFMVGARGAPWMATGVGRFASKSVNYNIQLRLAPLDASTQGTLGFELTARAITPTHVDLEAVLTRGGERQTIWTGAIATMLSDGPAILPFWTHQLVISPSGL